MLADGEAYARTLPESAQGGAAAVVGGATVAAAIAVGAGSYLDADWAKPLWKPFGARNGTAFMLGWPVAHRSRARRRRSSRTDALALAALASYPLWWWLGWDHGRRARPRSS